MIFCHILSIFSNLVILTNYVNSVVFVKLCGFYQILSFFVNANPIPLQHRYWAQVQSVQSGAARSAPSFVACSTNWRGRPPPVVRRESENAPANDNHLPFLWLENIYCVNSLKFYQMLSNFVSSVNFVEKLNWTIK